MNTSKGRIKELSTYDRLKEKIDTYKTSIWQDRRNDNHDEWLSNFVCDTGDVAVTNRNKLNALHLLSKFMYFGNTELREMLISMYRDLFKYPIVRNIRKNNYNTVDLSVINRIFQQELDCTRFLGVGNPSESGVHLLYYFRQENRLPKNMFINTHEIFRFEAAPIAGDEYRVATFISDPSVKRYVFIDDICGSGTQATMYSQNIVNQIKKLDPKAEVIYLMLFGTDHGIKNISANTSFDRVEAIFTIDDSFKAFSNNSRYFPKCSNRDGIDQGYCKALCEKHGNKLTPSIPLGYKDGQLLLSLFHNTPDNTLPIFWAEDTNWNPLFKRYHKIY